VTFLAGGQKQAYACFLYIRGRNYEWLTDLQAGLRGGSGKVMYHLEQCVNEWENRWWICCWWFDHGVVNRLPFQGGITVSGMVVNWKVTCALNSLER